MTCARSLLCVAVVLRAVIGVRVGTGLHGNPIRKVVTMLQNIQKQVLAEGKKEEVLFEEYMCYCKNGVGKLEQEIEEAETKVTELESSVKEASGQKKQLDADLVSHKADRSQAKEAVAEATALRNEEAGKFAKFKSESETNIAALGKAIVALEKGMGGAFLQTSSAQRLRTLSETVDMSDADRQELASFLEGAQPSEYAPQSGEITGILKQMKDEMEHDLSDASAAEATAIKEFDQLCAAKKKEISALNAAIESKLARVGEISVALAAMKNDLEDTSESLVEDKKFVADLHKNCETKAKEWDEIVKTRGEEQIALSETIKMLNDDDALELFKKTLPSSAASFMQVQVTATSMRKRALTVLRGAHQPRLDFIMLALHGKTAGFEKVTAMIDNMVVILKGEQKDDDKKKEYCDAEFDASDDKKKGLERDVSDQETAIEAAKGRVGELSDEIAALRASQKALDESVEEATKQRKAENQAHKDAMAENGAAKEVLGLAKNRLNKFYNPKMYKAAPKRQLSEEDQITVNMGGSLAATQPPGGIAGTGIAAALVQEAPGAAPEAPGPFKKKSEETNGVVAMMDILVRDLDKEMTVSAAEEKDAQADYEKFMKDSAEKRATDVKTLEDTRTAKADTEAALQEHESDKAATTKELAGTLKYIQSLHNECDWLLKYFDTRKEARAGEVDALGKAKAVLAGADYSFLELDSTRHLARSLRGRQHA